MRNILAISAFFLLYTAPVSSQSVKLDWVNSLAGDSYDACRAITLDSAGNIYATGYFSTTVDFDPGLSVTNLVSVNAEDAFLSKYDSSGKLIWAKGIGDFRYQAGYAIVVDGLGYIYITGIYFGTSDFDPGPGVANLTSKGNEDIFVCKYDNNGNFIWAKSFGGPTNEFCNAIKLDRFGNIYINGYFENTADFDPGAGVFNLTSAGSTDIFVCKLNNSGNLIWAKRIGGPSSDVAFSLGLDEFQNVYSTGFFWLTADFDPGSSTFNLTSNAFGDGFVLKLDASGNFKNAVQMGGNSRVRANSLKIDKTDHLYIAGYFDGEADFDPGPGIELLNSPVDDDDIFIAKFDLDLNFIWVKQIGGPSYQQVFGIEEDAADNIYLTGHYNGTADFDPGPGVYSLTALGDPDIFTLKLSSAGEFIWVAPATGPFFGSGYSLRVDQRYNVYVVGTYEGTIDFDPGPDELKLSSAGKSEIFIQKLRQCPDAALTETLNIQTCTSFTLYNKTYDSSGIYTYLILNSFGCDSIVIKLNLTISRITNNVAIDICQGELYLAGGYLQSKTGIYYDTLRTAAGCDSVTITHLTVREKPKPDIGRDRNICAGETILLDPGIFSTYLWQDLSTNPHYRVSMPGTYMVTVTNQFNCKASARIRVLDIIPLPANFLPDNQQLCSGNVYQIKVPGYKSYNWNTGATTANIDIRHSGNYYLTVTDYNNCTGTDSLTVQERNCIPIGIPNAFTPNNDGVNDYFKPTVNVEITEYELRVYNRVGQLIFQTRDLAQGWDGRFKNQQQSPSNYIYQISFRTNDGQSLKYAGNILLIR
ncbi:MAG: gliding motility-associated C-terminal domain-containing protein [Chitinophagaceae bacterium]|nr:gliding motility-associated C-terminal domain-containing protein [Chitinophagaceae bacterium]